MHRITGGTSCAAIICRIDRCSERFCQISRKVFFAESFFEKESVKIGKYLEIFATAMK